ncbi:hypothetical protein GWI33_008712 [Rhynchophorus ferrugineus]|uniref:Uncharacterized protein n=1 Tax=Rhynchophorus ferrugineus TaxID=354439 RepID=A0A834MC30_RHYFE|nr:hypothetical protein GWI33_008712 [Rhynchophorus ferrugineus]
MSLDTACPYCGKFKKYCQKWSRPDGGSARGETKRGQLFDGAGLCLVEIPKMLSGAHINFNFHNSPGGIFDRIIRLSGASRPITTGNSSFQSLGPRLPIPGNGRERTRRGRTPRQIRLSPP